MRKRHNAAETRSNPAQWLAAGLALVTVTTALATTLALGSCTSAPPPTPTAPPTLETPEPVLTSEHLDRILAEVSATLQAADLATSEAELGERVSGPARTMRIAEYDLAAISAGESPVTPLVTDSQVSVIAASASWPRVVTVVTTIPQGANLPLLLTLVQNEPRDPYALWSWVRLFPGVVMPPTTAPASGSQPVEPDSDALLLSPRATLDAYVYLINEGTQPTSNAKFPEDPFRTTYQKNLDALVEAVDGAGTATQHSSASEYGTASIGTHDGGAIVTGVIEHKLTLQRTEPDSTLSVGPTLAYGAEPEIRGTLIATYMTTVAFYVPPAGSSDPITVLGAERVLIAVERDDSTAPD